MKIIVGEAIQPRGSVRHPLKPSTLRLSTSRSAIKQVRMRLVYSSRASIPASAGHEGGPPSFPTRDLAVTLWTRDATNSDLAEYRIPNIRPHSWPKCRIFGGRMFGIRCVRFAREAGYDLSHCSACGNIFRSRYYL